jgi:hypothetical protein
MKRLGIPLKRNGVLAVAKAGSSTGAADEAEKPPENRKAQIA